MIIHRIKYMAAAVILAATALLGIQAPVSAVTQDKVHIMISPTRNRIALEPGDQYNGSFEVHNAGTDTFTYRVYATPYSVNGEDYSQDFSSSSKYTYLSEWITFSNTSGTLESGDFDTITYTIDVPENAAGGGQYAAIMAETDNGGEFTIQTVSRVGMLLYGRISGDVIEAGEIIENKVPTFFFQAPITASSLIDNTKSNVHATATYIMRVFPLFSDEEIYTNEEDPVKKTIFPDTRRFNTVEWPNSRRLGIYRIEQEVQFMGKTSVVRKIVIICPLWLIVLIFIIVIALILWLISRSKARKEARKERES